MSDQSPHPNNSPSAGPAETEDVQPALPSLRETIEAAYDDTVDEADASETGQTDRVRDNLGRFAARDRSEDTGEQSKDPAPKPDLEAQARQPEPAKGTQVPEHWSAEFKADFSKLPPEGQAIFLNRHREMEADYTRKSQASAGAVQFAQAIEPVFSDPDIAGSLQQSGLNAIQAIQEWGAMHKRAMSPDPQVRVGFMIDLAQRLGFDPARLFATSNRPIPELSEEDNQDPAIRFFANKLAETENRLRSFETQQQQRQQAEAQRYQEHIKDTHLQAINAFADAKDEKGNLLHPHFDAVVDDLLELYQLDPSRDLAAAYKKAVRMNDDVYQQVQETERHKIAGQSSAERARLAMRGNTRGITSPVAKPNANANGVGGLRGVLESSADEVGF